MSYQFRPRELKETNIKYGWFYKEAGRYEYKIGNLVVAQVVRLQKDCWFFIASTLEKGNVHRFGFRTAKKAMENLAKDNKFIVTAFQDNGGTTC